MNTLRHDAHLETNKHIQFANGKMIKAVGTIYSPSSIEEITEIFIKTRTL